MCHKFRTLLTSNEEQISHPTTSHHPDPSDCWWRSVRPKRHGNNTLTRAYFTSKITPIIERRHTVCACGNERPMMGFKFLLFNVGNGAAYQPMFQIGAKPFPYRNVWMHHTLTLLRHHARGVGRESQPKYWKLKVESIAVENILDCVQKMGWEIGSSPTRYRLQQNSSRSASSPPPHSMRRRRPDNVINTIERWSWDPFLST